MLSTAISGPIMLGLPITPSPSSASGIMFVIVFSQLEINLFIVHLYKSHLQYNVFLGRSRKSSITRHRSSKLDVSGSSLVNFVSSQRILAPIKATRIFVIPNTCFYTRIRPSVVMASTLTSMRTTRFCLVGCKVGHQTMVKTVEALFRG